MAKLSRRPHRQNRPRRSPPTRVEVDANNRLKIVVATAPHSADGGVSLVNDLRLVRSALLYADTVELRSPGAEMVGAVAALGAAAPHSIIDLLASLDDDTLRRMGSDPDQLRIMLRLAQLDRYELRRRMGPDRAREFRRQVQEMLDSATLNLDGASSTIYNEAGAEELDQAIEYGVLTVVTASEPLDMESYLETLKDLLQDPAAHLLFDEQISSLVAALIREGQIEPHRLAVAHAGDVVTGTGLVERLPAFPDTTMSAVLQAREELRDPLYSYRGAVAELAQKLEATPFGSDVAVELDDMWRASVLPAIQQLRRDLAVSRLATDAALATGSDVKSYISGAVAAALSMGVADLGPLPAAVLGGAVVGVQGLISAAQIGAANRDLARREQLFYLYELDRRL